jgi:hypothetical protein
MAKVTIGLIRRPYLQLLAAEADRKWDCPSRAGIGQRLSRINTSAPSIGSSFRCGDAVCPLGPDIRRKSSPRWDTNVRTGTPGCRQANCSSTVQVRQGKMNKAPLSVS